MFLLVQSIACSTVEPEAKRKSFTSSAAPAFEQHTAPPVLREGLTDETLTDHSLCPQRINYIPAEEGETYTAPEHVLQNVPYDGKEFIIDADVVVPEGPYRVLHLLPYPYDSNDIMDIMQVLEPQGAWTFHEGSQITPQKLEDMTRIRTQCACPDGRTAFYSNSVQPNDLIYKAYKDGQLYPEILLETGDPEYPLFQQEPSMSKEDAQALAEDFLDNLQPYIHPAMVLDWGQLCLCTTEAGQVLGWNFVYMREDMNLKAHFYDGYDVWQNCYPQWSAPWEQEWINVSVADNRVLGINAISMGKTDSVLCENVRLLPFDEMLPLIIKQLTAQHPGDFPQTTDWCLCIDRIRLGCANVSKDRKDCGYLIPAWYVEYKLQYRYESHAKAEPLSSFMTCFNAMDGTYIEPRVCLVGKFSVD